MGVSKMEEMINKVVQGDCLEIMRKMPDKSVDLCLTDPPYGIGMDKELHKKQGKYGYKDYGNTNWDVKPTKEYFDEMIRVSKNQIIWGGNYFVDYLYPSMGWMVWDKGQRNFSLADGELAWSSFQRALRIFEVSRAKALQDHKQHPTQKSLSLMKWCLLKSSEKNSLILDPFLGSGTTAVACKELHRRFIGIEISKEYCDIANLRLNNTIQDLF